MITDTAASESSYRRPGRPGLSQAQVDRAADALLQQGQRPAIEKIRAAIGGSPNTLGPMLDDWWRRLAARMQVGAGAFERLPGSLAQIAEAFFLHALDEARRVAKQEERREREALLREEHAVAVRSHVLSLREQELHARLADREQALNALELQLQDQSLLLRKLQATRAAATRRIALLEAELLQAQRPAPRKAATKRRALPKRSPPSRARRAKAKTRRSR